MRRAPRLGPYLIAGTFASSPDGRVYRAYNSNTDVEVLLITSLEEDAGTAETLRHRVADIDGRQLLEAHPNGAPAWVVLPRNQTDAAAQLIGLAAAPVQNAFAAAWGWPHFYPKTVRQLGFRCLCTVVGMALLFWVSTGLTNLARLLG